MRSRFYSLLNRHAPNIVKEAGNGAICLFVTAGIFLAAAMPIQAAQSTGGGAPGTNFTCDVQSRQCWCKGYWGSADCQAMSKNCKDGTPVHCREAGCTCTLATRNAPKQKGPDLRKIPGGGKVQ